MILYEALDKLGGLVEKLSASNGGVSILVYRDDLGNNANVADLDATRYMLENSEVFALELDRFIKSFGWVLKKYNEDELMVDSSGPGGRPIKVMRVVVDFGSGPGSPSEYHTFDMSKIPYGDMNKLRKGLVIFLGKLKQAIKRFGAEPVSIRVS